ncbi:MAG: hypothetical protein GY856_43380 [bacterium]|nr:hypothetical protein [bacterium]
MMVRPRGRDLLQRGLRLLRRIAPEETFVNEARLGATHHPERQELVMMVAG